MNLHLEEISSQVTQGSHAVLLLDRAGNSALPRIVASIVNGTAPADLTVTGLAKAQSYSWGEQERRVGL